MLPSLKVLAIAEAIYNLNESDQKWLVDNKRKELRRLMQHDEMTLIVQILPMTDHRYCILPCEVSLKGTIHQMAQYLADASFKYTHDSKDDHCKCDDCLPNICHSHRLSKFDHVIRQRCPTQEERLVYWIKRLTENEALYYESGFCINMFYVQPTQFNTETRV